MSDIKLKRKSIRVVTGPMASGKTKVFENLLNRAYIANQPVLSFTSTKDSDAKRRTIKSRDGDYVPIDYEIDSLDHLIKHVEDYLRPIEKEYTQLTAELITNPKSKKLKTKLSVVKRKMNLVVLADEVQFYDQGTEYLTIRKYLKKIIEISLKGPQFIFFGLNLTHELYVYKIVCLLAGISDEFIIRTALCEWCGKEGAKYSKKIKDVVGSYDAGKDKYFPACDKCYYNPKMDFPFLQKRWKKTKKRKKCKVI